MLLTAVHVNFLVLFFILALLITKVTDSRVSFTVCQLLPLAGSILSSVTGGTDLVMVQVMVKFEPVSTSVSTEELAPPSLKNGPSVE